MIFPGFPGVLSFFQVFQVFQVEWEPWYMHRNYYFWTFHIKYIFYYLIKFSLTGKNFLIAPLSTFSSAIGNYVGKKTGHHLIHRKHKVLIIFNFISLTSENLADISLRETLNLVNPVPFWRAVDTVGDVAASNTKLLATTGYYQNYKYLAAGNFRIDWTAWSSLMSPILWVKCWILWCKFFKVKFKVPKLGEWYKSYLQWGSENVTMQPKL